MSERISFSTFYYICVAAKLTEIIKKEMLERFLKGNSLSSISKEFGCTPSTVTRAVKLFLTEGEFAELKNNRIKNKIHQRTTIANSPSAHNQSSEKPSLNSHEPKSIVGTIDKLSEISDSGASMYFNSNDAEAFTEIIPLGIEPFSDVQKEVACKPLRSNSLPDTVFILISKNNELESKPLRDLSEWSFLPDKDQDRLAIPLFLTHRDAKRICSRNQKVLKVPNSNVFFVSLPYLISKGITRLIIDQSLISLDS